MNPPFRWLRLTDRRSAWTWSATAFLLLVAYVLSPIPFGVVAAHLGFDGIEPLDTAFEVFYAPLIWLHDHVEFVHDFYDWYGDAYDRMTDFIP